MHIKSLGKAHGHKIPKSVTEMLDWRYMFNGVLHHCYMSLKEGLLQSYAKDTKNLHTYIKRFRILRDE